MAPGDVPGVEPCHSCAVAAKLPRGTCACFSDENLASRSTWLKRQPTLEGKNHDKITSRLRTYSGSVMELLESVEARVKPYQHHLWNARFIRRQLHLDCD